MKIDGSAPKRAKRMTPEAFLAWVAQLRNRCDELHSCYEAGPFGYGLHRRLIALGVRNYVIRPVNWDKHGKRVKTDARDARQMALHLDGYLNGNSNSFSVVHVPSEAEERHRALTRQRQSFVKERQRTHLRGQDRWTYFPSRRRPSTQKN